MTTHEASYSREEFARRGREIYERMVTPSLQPGDEGKFAAIDIESGIYELDSNDFAATEHLLTRHPEAQIWLVQVGQPAAYRLGVRSTRGTQG